jgi:imidazole glycerol-phosphate synthase subunit HisH
VLTVIDYEAGNLRSVETALQHLGATFTISGDPGVLAEADRIIFPGVGDAAAAMTRLDEGGLSGILRSRAKEGVPILGICLGSQIILEGSEENDATCLGIMEGQTVAFDSRPGRKVPHMGWNTLEIRRDHPLFTGIPGEAAFYFVHSYYPRPAADRDILAVTEYGETFPSAIGRKNVVATQFHPEKSGEFGLKMIQNFLSWNGGL